MVRIFYVCDIHGSNTVWAKIIGATQRYKFDVLMVYGDLTGKAIVPIVKIGENKWYCAPWGKKEILRSEKQVEHVAKIFNGKGFYTYITTEDELEELKNNPQKLDKLFTELMKERLRAWIRQAEEKVPKEKTIIMMPGNDDRFEIDEVIMNSERVIYPVKRVIYINDKYPLISCEWVNTTPWNTPRQCTDEELERILEKEFERVDKKEMERLICGFHAPPYNTNLDIATKLDKNLRPVTRLGFPVKTHVGSKAVRKLLEKYQPMLGLHGHIHESKGVDKIKKKTICINPGSEYEEGVLKACIVEIKDNKIKHFFVEG